MLKTGPVHLVLFLCLLVCWTVEGRNVVTRHIYEINADVHDVKLFYGDVLRSDDDVELLQGVDTDIDTDTNPDEGDQLTEAYDLVRLRAIVKKTGNNRWSNNELPYEISNSYSAHEKQQIESAISSLQGMTCFKFPKRKRQRDYVYIDKKDGCYSFVGKRGIEHEHQRPDRDKYIKVKFENVDGNMKSNFDKIPFKSVDLHGLGYDYDSVMHYDGKAFGKTDSSGRKLDTMVPLRSGVSLRDNTQLTSQDKKKLAILGNCDGGKGKSGGKGKKKRPSRKKGKRGRKRKRLMEPIYDYDN